MRFSLKTLLALTTLIAIVFAVYLYRNGEHKIATIEFPDGMEINFVADNIPSKCGRHRAGAFLGRSISCATKSELNSIDDYPPIEFLKTRFGTSFMSVDIPETVYGKLEFGITSTKDSRIHGVYEKGFPNSLLFIYDSKTKSIVSSRCHPSICYRNCAFPRPKLEIFMLRELNSGDSVDNFALIRCGTNWYKWWEPAAAEK